MCFSVEISSCLQDMKKYAKRQRSLQYICKRCPFSTQDKKQFNNHNHAKDINKKKALHKNDVCCTLKEKSCENGEHRYSPTSKSKITCSENDSLKKQVVPKDQSMDSSTLRNNKAEELSLADIWMRHFDKTDTRLAIPFSSDDDIRNVFRVDIAQLWNVASYLAKNKGELFECDVCGYTSRVHDHVHEHIGATHLGLSSWMCPYCQFKIRHRMAVVNHLKSAHKGLDWFVIRYRGYRSGGFRDTIESALHCLPPFPILDEDHVKSYALVAKERYAKGYMSNMSLQNHKKAQSKSTRKVKNKGKMSRYKCNMCNNAFESVAKCEKHYHTAHRQEQKEVSGVGMVAVVLDMANKHRRLYCCPGENCSYVSSKKYLVTLHKFRGCRDKQRSCNFQCHYCTTMGNTLLFIKRHSKRFHVGLPIIAQVWTFLVG